MTKYSGIFSKVYVVDNGKRIVHVKGNHSVSRTIDVAVETVTTDGKKKTIKVEKFIAKHQPGTKPGKPRISTAPQYKWLQSVKSVDSKGITIVNALNKSTNLAWN